MPFVRQEDRRRTLRGLMGIGAVYLGAGLAFPVAADSGVRRATIRQFAFAPDVLRVNIGESIEWLNADLVPHTATAVDGSWDTGQLRPGQSEAIRYMTPGIAEYICAFHPHMRGRVEVSAD